MKFADMLEGVADTSRRQYWARDHWGHRCYVYKDGDVIMYSSNGYNAIWVIPHCDLFADNWKEVIPHP